MYVKWEDRWTRRGTAAVLVESSRVGGKPRQRHIAYLGTYPSSLQLMAFTDEQLAQIRDAAQPIPRALRAAYLERVLSLIHI